MAIKNLPAAPGLGLNAAVALTMRVPPLVLQSPTQTLINVAQAWSKQQWDDLLRKMVEEGKAPSAAAIAEVWTTSLWIFNTRTQPPLEAL